MPPAVRPPNGPGSNSQSARTSVRGDHLGTGTHPILSARPRGGGRSDIHLLPWFEIDPVGEVHGRCRCKYRSRSHVPQSADGIGDSPTGNRPPSRSFSEFASSMSTFDVNLNPPHNAPITVGRNRNKRMAVVSERTSVPETWQESAATDGTGQLPVLLSPFLEAVMHFAGEVAYHLMHEHTIPQLLPNRCL
jgi:hypothetical protein